MIKTIWFSNSAGSVGLVGKMHLYGLTHFFKLTKRDLYFVV